MRLGLSENSAKNAFVLANGDKAYSAIYVHSSQQPVNDSGLVAPKDVPGNVHRILTQKQNIVENPNTAIFFSVANIGEGHDSIPGVGLMMVKRIHGHLSDFNMKSTLSPFRFFRQYGLVLKKWTVPSELLFIIFGGQNGTRKTYRRV